MTENIYTFDKKKKLANRIEKLKNKTYLHTIRKMIFDENPTATSRKSKTGYLMYFHNYTNDTYVHIENYLKSLEENKNKSIFGTNECYTDLDSVKTTNMESNDTDYETTRTRLRFSNQEKRLIKKRQYADDDIVPVSSLPNDSNKYDDNEE